MLGVVLAFLFTVAVVAWMISGGEESEERVYTREKRLTHYPSGYVEVEEREY